MLISTAALMSVMYGVITQEPSPSHQAYDISCQVGRPIYALHDGQLDSRRSPHLGNTVTIQGDGITSLYAHMHEVDASGYVVKGQQIGTCGNTGSWSTGPHLHLEVVR